MLEHNINSAYIYVYMHTCMCMHTCLQIHIYFSWDFGFFSCLEIVPHKLQHFKMSEVLQLNTIAVSIALLESAKVRYLI